MEIAFIKTPLGIAKVKGDKDGLSIVYILDGNKPISDIIPKVLEDAVYQLQQYFRGERQNFSLKLNPHGTDFQKKVWQYLSEIPFGKTLSYLNLSKRMENVKAIRAVAAANGKNPLWIVIPCHRVIGSDGSLTGYAGGLDRKKWLLDHESAIKQTSLL